MRKETLDELVSFLNDMDEDMAASNDRSIKRSKVTSAVIWIVMIIMGLLFLLNAKLLMNLARGMDNSLQTVDELVVSFGSITGDMSDITHSVHSMNNNLEAMDIMSESMQQIQGNVADMDTALVTINESVGGVKGRLFGVDEAMSRVDGNMRGIGHNVRNIGGSVNQISRPAKIMNSFMPW